MNVSFISLGCDKNRVNTEQMMAMCLQAGMTVQEDVNGSDVVVINTCGFIDSAKTEAIETILSAAELKAAGEVKKILVTGCLSQRYRDEMMTELPEIDGMMGTADYGDIVTAVEQVMSGVDCAHFSDINGAVEELGAVDDAAYAGVIARHYGGSYGPGRVRQELQKRGIPRELWDDALAQLPDSAGAIDAFLRSKLKGKAPDRATLKKLSDALLRRGFSWQDIRPALNRLGEEIDE